MFVCYVALLAVTCVFALLALVLEFSRTVDGEGTTIGTVSAEIRSNTSDRLKDVLSTVLMAETGAYLRTRDLSTPATDGPSVVPKPQRKAKPAQRDPMPTQRNPKPARKPRRDGQPRRTLPHHRGPWHHSWNNSIAVCAIMRQENITDVVEWLSYYKCVPCCLLPETNRTCILWEGAACARGGWGLELACTP
jgi:hypothetical protein